MNVAEARTHSRYERSTCKRCGDFIFLGEPIFLWEAVWVCEQCNVGLVSGSDWLEALFVEVPVAYREKVFRALLTAFHPDHGGDAAMTKRLLHVRNTWTN